MPITGDQAFTENEFHYGTCTRTEGPRGGVTIKREVWRRNGITKTWKTRPGEFRIPVKYGLRTYGAIWHGDAPNFHAASACPLDKEE